jgi:hypothetical protein
MAIGWDGFLREDCSDLDTLRKAARRETELLEKYEHFNEDVHWRKKHHGFDDRWSHIKTLFLLQADFNSTLRMGKGDWRQLGAGWYFLEEWETGPVRWSGRRAEAYLAADRGSRGLRLRVFSGNAVLGTGITGSIKVFYSRDRNIFTFMAENTFDIPAGIWTDLGVPFQEKISEHGIIRLILEVNQSRIPERLIPGSTDTRELGVAVAGMAVI